MYAWEFPRFTRFEAYTAYTARRPGDVGIATDWTFDFTNPVRGPELYTLGDGSETTAEHVDVGECDRGTRIVLRDSTDPSTLNLDDISFGIRSE